MGVNAEDGEGLTQDDVDALRSLEITREWLRQHDACWSDKRIDEAFGGRRCVSLRDVAAYEDAVDAAWVWAEALEDIPGATERLLMASRTECPGGNPLCAICGDPFPPLLAIVWGPGHD